MVRHRAIERSDVVRTANPLLADAVRFIGHGAIRNRGTIGGSIAHADPAAELPAVLLALDGEVEARRAAVKNARRQAEVYADAAGVQLGEILEITEGTAGGLGSEAALRMPAPM